MDSTDENTRQLFMSQPTGHLGNFCFGSFVLDIEEHTLPSIQPFGAILTILGFVV
jgi:hypothetical protein